MLKAPPAPQRGEKKRMALKYLQRNAVVDREVTVIVKTNYCYLQLTTQFLGGHGDGAHPFPFRTGKLSPSAPMVLLHQVGE